MARKSKGWMIVSIGPTGKRGTLSRTVREKESSGNCDHCGHERKFLFSYADDGIVACNKSCWIAEVLTRAGVRQPSRSQVTQQNKRASQRNQASLATVVPLHDRRKAS